VGGKSFTATMHKCIGAHGAAHVANVHGGAWATGTWLSSCCVREASDRTPFKRPEADKWGPTFFIFLRFSNTKL
jgi:hypothetical protein